MVTRLRFRLDEGEVTIADRDTGEVLGRCKAALVHPTTGECLDLADPAMLVDERRVAQWQVQALHEIGLLSTEQLLGAEREPPRRKRPRWRR